MQNKTSWRAWVAALAFFGVAGAILYAGVFKEDRIYDSGEASAVSVVFPFGDSLDFRPLEKRYFQQSFAYPKVSLATEVGVDLSSLFKTVSQGTALQQGPLNFSR